MFCARVSFAAYRRNQLKSHLATAGKCSMDWSGVRRGGAAGGSKRGGLQHAYPCGAFVVGTHSTRRQLAIFLDLPPLRIPDSRWPIPIRFPFPSWGLEPPFPLPTSYKTPLQSKPSKQKPTTARFFNKIILSFTI